MIKKDVALILIICLIGTLFSGCAAPKNAADDGRLNIVTTIFPEYDFARAIADDRANISMLMAPGASVHSFDPSPSDIAKVQNADIFICVGSGKGDWADRVLESVDTSNIKVLRLMEHVKGLEEEIKQGMQHEQEEHEEQGEELLDEHIWTSPQNAIRLIEIVRDAIIEKDGENAEFYSQNAANYQDGLRQVDEDIKKVVAEASRKKIIVADKFPFLYFVKQYGLDYEAAFPGCSDQADASAQTVAHLVNTVEREHIPYIYYVELSNKSVAEAIAEQTGAGMLLLHSCHNVSKDEFGRGVTYLSLVKGNKERLRKGLN